MWGRFVVRVIYRGIAFLALPFFMAILSNSGKVFSQEIPLEIENIIAQEAERGNENIDELIELCLWVSEHPININAQDSALLWRIPLLSDFQIVSILDYRRNYGQIYSKSELSYVSGFDKSSVEKILPFITFEDAGKFAKNRVRNDIVLRSGRFHSGRGISAYNVYSRYRFEYGDMVQAGFTAECDKGEMGMKGAKYPDFLSAFVGTRNLSFGTQKKFVISSLVLGDFSVRFGQGLSVWNSFSLSSFANPSSIFKKEFGVTPYRSCDENNFFRGLGLSSKICRNISLSVFYSHNMVDARVEDGWYFSLPRDGYHDTSSKLKTRKTLAEDVLGGNLSYRWKMMKVGVSMLAYSFDKENMREKKYYNKYQIYNGWWGNFASDFNLSLQGKRLFGELALDAKGHFASLMGFVWFLNDNIDLSVLARYYSPYYIAPHAGAYSSISSVSNQTGASVNIKYSYSYDLSLSFCGEYNYYPMPRYRVFKSSSDLEGKIDISYLLSEKHRFQILLKYKWLSYNKSNKMGIRVTYKYKFLNDFVLEGRGELSYLYESGSDLGKLLFVGLNYLHPNNIFQIAVRGTVFHIDSWDNRIYAYQSDLPGTFSVPVFYGRSYDFYLYAKIKLGSAAKLSMKLGMKRAKLQLNLKF